MQKNKTMSKQKIYKVSTEFVFSGVFEVKAENREQAKAYINNDCGLVLGGNIHSTLNDEQVDWDFDTHPTTIIKRVRIKKDR